MGDLHEWRQLVAKVDAKVAEIAGHRVADLACKAGCHGCCAPGLSVTAVEAAAIADWVGEHPEVATELAELETQKVWGDSRCLLLRVDGTCAVYPVRPLVCRTQGMPIVLESGKLTTCELNFGAGMADLAAADRLDQRTLSTLLFVVDQRHGGGDRRPLTWTGLRPRRAVA